MCLCASVLLSKKKENMRICLKKENICFCLKFWGIYFDNYIYCIIFAENLKP